MQKSQSKTLGLHGHLLYILSSHSLPFRRPISSSSMEKKLAEQHGSLLKQISSHPLFSIVTTFFLLNFLYLPNLLPLIFSPVLITTSLILTTLLHFRSPKPETPPPKDTAIDPIQIQLETPCEPTTVLELHDQNTHIHVNSFVEWGRKISPLEVIYEEYEGEEDESDSQEYSGTPEYSHMIAASPKGRLYYFGCSSSTDSDVDSDGSLDDICFGWDEDEDEDEMIEIALEEDNLIEIDLSACR